MNKYNDQILKFALTCSEDEGAYQLRDILHHRVGHLILPVTSGYGSIDLIVPGFHKTYGI